MAEKKRCITIDCVNPNVKVMEYAIRGPVTTKARELEKELEQGATKSFKKVIKANYGDCHAMGQIPITFIRQVTALVLLPDHLMKDPSIPDDVKKRAKCILEGCKGSVGSYTESPGIEIIRRHVADFIQRRDGYPSDWQNIFLTSGVADGMRAIFRFLNCETNGKQTGIMVPVPMYPLYSALITETGMHQIDYYMDEDNNWALDMKEMQRALDEGKTKCNPKILAVLNPGNPTGQVLTRQNIEDIIKFAYKENLLLFADEVYQENIYDDKSKFYSFKKVMMDMGPPYSNHELISFMSCSKGYMGECGLRGGYLEMMNICPKVRAAFLNMNTAMVCPNVIGQTVVDCVANPPQKGEPSYELFMKEKTEVLLSLKHRAKLIADTFNTFKGFRCNPVQGAMYGFPRIELPPKAIEAAKKAEQPADTFYAYRLLEKTGICVVPGNGFGQKPGTYHFRTTILPQVDVLKDMLQKFAKFHQEFVTEYQ